MRVLRKKVGTGPPFIAYLTMFLLGIMVAAGYETLGDYIIESNQRELLRVTSPDGQLDAVFVEPILHTFGEDSAVYLVPRGEPPPSNNPVISGVDFNEPPALRWKQTHLLSISYRHGCIDRFSNLWHSEDVDDGRYFVETRLNPTGEFTCVIGRIDASSAGKP